MIQILVGDCREVLKTLEADSLHACVTDPPYELGFMGKVWDATGVANDPATWREVLRVLKPGAHLLAFGGTRTHHRMICAIEDAGFEIRDCLGWLYGSGFPKSRNQDGEWLGWGTALKPAWEPIVLARKPLIGTVADNLREHRTGAINVDGGRVAHAEECKMMAPSQANIDNPSEKHRQAGRRTATLELKASGRWPANILHDGSDEVLAIFPRDAGASAPVTGNEPSPASVGTITGERGRVQGAFHGDKGSAARFFYCAKVGRAERDVGLQGFDKKAMNWSSGEKSPGTFQSENTDRSARNHHPTVKPVELMRYLIRLITPPGGTVLDPFTGSGSTLRAADVEGFNAIGIELNPEYAAIARSRVNGDMPLFAEVA